MNVELRAMPRLVSTIDTALQLIHELRSKRAPGYKIRILVQAIEEVETGKRSVQELNDLIYRYRNREVDTSTNEKK